MSNPACAYCGRTLDEHDRHIRYSLPDSLFALKDPEKAAIKVDTPGAANFAGYGDRLFIRTLVPVHLDDGSSVTFGAWLEVQEPDFRRAVESWNASSYADLSFKGQLANAIPPWRELVMGRECHARTLIDDAIPYVVSSSDDLMSRVLHDSWSAADMNAALPGRS